MKGQSFWNCHVLGMRKTWQRSVFTAFGDIISCQNKIQVVLIPKNINQQVSQQIETLDYGKQNDQ